VLSVGAHRFPKGTLFTNVHTNSDDVYLLHRITYRSIHTRYIYIYIYIYRAEEVELHAFFAFGTI
jgi:hypothetical protein